MPYIELNDIKLFYVLHKLSENGINYEDAKNIVLIHGAGANHLSMLSIFNYIKKKFGKSCNILVPDLPFHFRSARKSAAGVNSFISEKEGMPLYAETVNVLASKLFEKNKKVLLIGHSMGAQVCMKYAFLFPENVEKIMVIAGCHNTGISGAFIKSLESSFDRTIMLFLKDALNSRDKNILNNALSDIKRTPDETVINDFKYSKYYGDYCREDLDEINRRKIFFHIIYSKKDLIVAGECALELHKKLENSTIDEITAKNHVDFLYGNYWTEKEIDKFLLTQTPIKL